MKRKKKKEGGGWIGGALEKKRKRERRCQRRASPQVLAAGGALEPIRPTSVYKSGRTHIHLFSIFLFFLFFSPLSLSLYLLIFYPPLFCFAACVCKFNPAGSTFDCCVLISFQDFVWGEKPKENRETGEFSFYFYLTVYYPAIVCCVEIVVS